MDANKINTVPARVIAEGQSTQPSRELSSQSDAKSASNRSTAGLFITPVIQFDSETLSVIFRVRDGLSGEVKQEYPQQSVIKGRQAIAEAAARRVDVSSSPTQVEVSEPASPRVEASTGGAEVRIAPNDTGSSSGNENNDIASSSIGVARGLGNA